MSPSPSREIRKDQRNRLQARNQFRYTGTPASMRNLSVPQRWNKGRSRRRHGVLVSPDQVLGRSTGPKRLFQTRLGDLSASSQHFPQRQLKLSAFAAVGSYQSSSQKQCRRNFLDLRWKEHLLQHHSLGNPADPFHPSPATSTSFKFGAELYLSPGNSRPDQECRWGYSE